MATLQELQDGFASVSKVTAIVFDASGGALTRVSTGDDLSRLLLASSVGRSKWTGCAAAAAQQVLAASGTCIVEGPGGLLRMAAPILVDGKMVGSLVIGGRPVGPVGPDKIDHIAKTYEADAEQVAAAMAAGCPWSEADLEATSEFLQLFSGTIGRLCSQENQLRQRVDELSAIYNVAALFSGGRDLEEVLRLTAQRVAEVLGAKASSIRLLDEAAGELHIRAVHNLSEAYLDKGAVILEENPIDAEAIRERICYVADAPNDPRTRYPEQARQEGIVSGLCAGMLYRGKVVGVIRVYMGRHHRFSSFETSMLQAIASAVAAGLTNARLVEEGIAAERYSRQIRHAGVVQRRMIPQRAPRVDFADFGGVYDPSYEVGGDFYDFVPLPFGNTGIAIADVSGKGIAASLLMASVRSALRVYAHTNPAVEEVVSLVNRSLCRDTLPAEFATLFYGVLSSDGRKLTYCNAGHEPTMLLRDGKIERLRKGGALIGVQGEAMYDSGVVDLRPGDVLLLMTDGVFESLNFEDEAFGRRRVEASLRRHQHLPAQQMAKNIQWDVRRFVGLADRTDDLTLVVVKMK